MSNPFQYFSKEGPYVLPEDTAFTDRQNLLGPDAKANEQLHWFSKIGDFEGVKHCLEKGFAEVDARNAMLGWTALHYAAHGNHEKIVRYLLQEAHATLDAKAWDGIEAVELSSGDTHTFMSRWALEVRRRRRQALDAIKRNRPRGTATSICNEKPEQNIVTTSKAPYERQHSVDRLSNRYEKGILNSIGTFSPDARLLTQRSQSDTGTSRTSSSTRALLSVATIVDAKNESLRRAANNGNMKTVKKLVACGVNPNHCNKLTGWNALHYSAYANEHEVLKYLLETARGDPAIKTADGRNVGEVAVSGIGGKKGECAKLCRKWLSRRRNKTCRQNKSLFTTAGASFSTTSSPNQTKKITRVAWR